MKDLKREDIIEVLQDELEGIIDDVASDYNSSGNPQGEELEYKARSGYVPYIDGGYKYTFLSFAPHLEGSGIDLPTKVLQDKVEEFSKNADEHAQSEIWQENQDEEFRDKFPTKEDVNYSDLEEFDSSYAEEFDEIVRDYRDDESIKFSISAMYYNPENDYAEDGKNTITLTGSVNLEAPYHRRGFYEDFKEITFTFSSLESLEKKLRNELDVIKMWFEGSDYKTSTTELKQGRLEKGGSLNWEENFKELNLNEEELEYVSKMVFMADGGIGEVIERKEKNPKDFKESVKRGVKISKGELYAKGGVPYSKRFFDIVEYSKDGTIVRKIENKNTYEAEDIAFKLNNTNPVRSGYHYVKMEERFAKGGKTDTRNILMRGKKVRIINTRNHNKEGHLVSNKLSNGKFKVILENGKLTSTSPDNIMLIDEKIYFEKGGKTKTQQDFLNKWEEEQRNYYEYFDDDELERDYRGWNLGEPSPELTQEDLIDALIEVEKPTLEKAEKYEIKAKIDEIREQSGAESNAEEDDDYYEEHPDWQVYAKGGFTMSDYTDSFDEDKAEYIDNEFQLFDTNTGEYEYPNSEDELFEEIRKGRGKYRGKIVKYYEIDGEQFRKEELIGDYAKGGKIDYSKNLKTEYIKLLEDNGVDISKLSIRHKKRRNSKDDSVLIDGNRFSYYSLEEHIKNPTEFIKLYRLNKYAKGGRTKGWNKRYRATYTNDLPYSIYAKDGNAIDFGKTPELIAKVKKKGDAIEVVSSLKKSVNRDDFDIYMKHQLAKGGNIKDNREIVEILQEVSSDNEGIPDDWVNVNDSVNHELWKRGYEELSDDKKELEDLLMTQYEKRYLDRGWSRYAKGGEVKKKGNEMLIGGLAGVLLGIFLNK